jgi:alpha-N-arabinofuranosidase
MKPLHLLLGPMPLAAVFSIAASAASIIVQTDKPGAAPTQFGIFFEDINYAGDGGLYPERIKNRSFEFKEPLMGWKQIARGGASATTTVQEVKPLNASNPHYLRLASESETGAAGLVNEGFFGVGVQDGAEFTFSVYARSADAAPPALLVEIDSADGRKLGEAKLAGLTRDWQRHSVKVRSTGTDPKARVNILLAGRGALDLDMVSLFPLDNWGRRPNGLRTDLVRLLAELKPAFMRFPGGCIVEGHTLPQRYQWKTTIGDLAARKLIINRWNDEFKHRPAPDYFQSFGLGFYEYFQLCEDIGAAPLPNLNCGMACQFNSGELAPLDQLDPYIQDALDLIEFANGPADSAWGAPARRDGASRAVQDDDARCRQ